MARGACVREHAVVSAPADPLLEQTAHVVAQLRERCAAADPGPAAEELLIGGYAAALALEGARRRLRADALAASERELRLAAQERELRALLRALRERLRRAASADEPAAQRLH